MGTIIDDQSIGFYCSPLKQEIQFFEKNAFIYALTNGCTYPDFKI